jgi:hypothetical protein
MIAKSHMDLPVKVGGIGHFGKKDLSVIQVRSIDGYHFSHPLYGFRLYQHQVHQYLHLKSFRTLSKQELVPYQ